MKLIQTICLALFLTANSFHSPIQAQASAGYFLHTVAKGQGLYSIASMYGITVADILRLNPKADEQLHAGETLKIPQLASSQTDGKQFHTIQAGETLYQLTVKYNVSAQAICNANPGLSAANFRIGQVIVIPQAGNTPQAPSDHPTAVDQTSPRQQTGWKDMHKVEKKETVFSISQQYGISQEELIAANPELRNGKLKKGSFLFIPYSKKQPSQTTGTKPATTPSNEELFRINRQVKSGITTLKIAVVLPFTSNAGHDEQSRMVEFYEGFLMAADSLKRQGMSADIYTYDSKGTEAGIQNILTRKELKDMDIIFGPVNQACLAPLSAFADANHIRLVVPFSPKVDQVFKSPYIYQVNTPQSYLYSEVYEHFIRKFRNCNVIFCDDGNNDRDKAEFIRGLKSELKDNHMSFKQIQLNTNTDPKRIIAAMDTLGNNVFIPTSGKSTTLTRILPYLTMVRREHPHFNMHLFGYPEWQTYTQDFLSSFYELDTYFYSSFYTNNLFPAAISFTRSYRRWFSKDMSNTYPKYGMLGFDIGYFFLKGLMQQGNKLEDNLHRIQVTPIQTGFKFERVNNWGGFINRKVFFVHFTKDYELIKLDFE